MNHDIRCPYCGESYYMENYTASTAMYAPMVWKDGELISTDPNYHTTYCTCLNCQNNFSYTLHDGDCVVEEML